MLFMLFKEMKNIENWVARFLPRRQEKSAPDKDTGSLAS
jgi:hypothetical protein